MIQSHNPVLPKTIGNKNSLANNFEKSYYNENLKSNSSINNKFKKQISSVNPNIVVNENLDQSRNLEIQSDKQFQENNVIYAEGNVLVTFK